MDDIYKIYCINMNAINIAFTFHHWKNKFFDTDNSNGTIIKTVAIENWFS